ncbi:MAG TPA: hypothetical protein VH500_02220 [Nitrososphaeraceae archaeon]|jgi:hypothetical protein
MKSIDEVKKIKERVEKQLLEKGASAVSIGAKIEGGQKQNKIALKVYVPKKVKKEEVPDDKLIPDEIEGVITDVLEQPDPSAEPHNGSVISHDQDLHTIMCGGISCGVPEEIGTIGAIVLSQSGEPMIMGARHVLAYSPNSKVNDSICNPGENLTHVIAFLQDSELNSTIDAAVAKLKDPNKFECKIFGLGPVNGSINEAELHQMYTAYLLGGPPIPVEKRGITTGRTSGFIEDIDYGPIPVRYDHGLPSINLNDQILIAPDNQSGNRFSNAGDSGSCICTPLGDSRKVVALLSGGFMSPSPADGKYRTYASHIQATLDRFHVSICKA